jgi:transposase
LLDLPNELDFSSIMAPALAKDSRGEKGFDPRMMTLLLLYAYCIGITSSRKIERACYEDLAFRVLTGNQQPDHSRISEFRRRNLDALSALFVQILRLCQKAGMVSLGLVALDGTKVKANASKHKAMSHERMLKAEAQLEKEIEELMREAEIVDAQEDGKYGKGKRGSDLPEELQRREDRLEKIRQARKELEAETAAVAARERLEQATAAEEAAQVASEEERQKLHTKAERAREKAEAGDGKSSAGGAGATGFGTAGERSDAKARFGSPSGWQSHSQNPEKLHRSRQPHHEREWRDDSGLQLPGGGGWRSSGDRGCGSEQPTTGCGTSRTHAGAHDRQHRRLSDNLHR